MTIVEEPGTMGSSSEGDGVGVGVGAPTKEVIVLRGTEAVEVTSTTGIDGGVTVSMMVVGTSTVVGCAWVIV